MKTRLLAAFVVAAAQAANQTPPPGRLIDLGGHRLHIHCLGTGTPAVIIDAGVGGGSPEFAAIQRRLAELTTVCTYDRAGMNWSEPGPLPRTSGVIVEEMHRLMHAAGLVPPLVLAGHSFGGYNVRIYQSRYPEEVGAVVLLDSAHPQQNARLIGVKEALKGAIASASPAVAAEMQALDVSVTQVPTSRLPEAMPFVVLTARNSFDAFRGTGLPLEQNARIWNTLQDELAALSDRTIRIFSGGDHRLYKSDPEAVVRAITRAVDEVRNGGGEWPAALGLSDSALPLVSTRLVDGLLLELEEAYRSMDLGLWEGLFTPDFTQLDVPRRVHMHGIEAWMDWTRRLNDAHRVMARIHRGRAVVGDVVIVEIEWSGVLRGAASGGQDRPYRFTGLALMELDGRKIKRQVVYGDAPMLSQQIER